MDSVSCRRWSLAFVAYRWRHLMWTFPLAGLLVAGASEWQKYQRSLQPSGEIAVALPSRLPVPSLFAARFSTLGFAEIQQLALSDEVLAAACDYAQLPKNGDSPEKCISELRPRVQCTPIPGSSSALISVAGKPSPETKLLTEAVVRKIAWHAEQTAFAARKELLKQDENDLAEFRKSIDGPIGKPIIIKTVVTESKEQPKPISDFVVERFAAKEEYTKRKIQLYGAMTFHRANPGPLFVKRWPSTPLPLPTTRQRLQEGAPTVVIGAGTGILAAVALAYLLEALLPTRRQQSAADSLTGPQP